MMKKLSLLLGAFCLCVVLSSCGNNNEIVSDSEASTENTLTYTKDIDSYYAKDGDTEKLVANLDDDDIFEIGKNIIISNDEVAQYENFYRNAGEDDALAKAQEYARERNALYAAAIENGFTVNDDDINSYLNGLKEEIKSNLSDDKYQKLCADYGSEDDYWAFEFEVYKINLPIQNFTKSLENQYDAENSSISWDEKYEKIKQELVEKQNFRSL